MWLFWVMVIVIGIIIPSILWIVYFLVGCKGPDLSSLSSDENREHAPREEFKRINEVNYLACITCAKRSTCSRSRCDGFITDKDL